MKKELVDARALLEEARDSGHGESYRITDRGQCFRIGVGVRLKANKVSFFIDALVNLCPDSPEVELSILERKLEILRGLKLRGYSLSCQDSGSVLCELDVPEKEIAPERESIKAICEHPFPKCHEHKN